MPYINTNVSVSLNEDQEEKIKSRFGKAITTLGKPESYLMVSLKGDCSLYFAGEKLDKGAMVEVSLFGNASSSAYNKMTGQICDILEEELGIPGNHIYVTYQPIANWGWDGSNF